MAGLGFANPELQRAQRLAMLNGSTALPMGAGAPAPQMMPAPQAQAPAMPQQQLPPSPQLPQQAQAPMPQAQPPVAPPAAAQSSVPAPDAEDDGLGHYAKIAGAIGHVILSAEAGYNGKPMPPSPFGDPADKQAQDMKLTQFLMNTVARGWEASRNAPPEQRNKMLQQFSDVIKRVAPDFDFMGFIDALETDGDKVDELAPQLATMSEEAKRMFMARVRASGQDPAQAAAEAIKDDAFMKQLAEYDDEVNVPSLNMKLYKVKQAMKSLQMPEDAFSGMTIEDLRRVNEQLPESARLTPSELSTLARHPEMGEVIGMRPPGRQPGGVDDATGYVPKKLPPRPTPRPETDDTDLEDETPPAPDEVAPAQPPAPRRPAPRPQPSPQGAAAPRQDSKPKPAPSYYPPGWKPRQPKPVEGAPPAQAKPAPRTVKPAAPVPVSMTAGPKKAAQAPARDQISVDMPDRKAPEKKQFTTQRFRVPRDMQVPGVGPVKKGEVIIYIPETGAYRRGK
jgi:hypothetical protein